MAEKRRILHILPSNSFSGAENVVCQIIHMFQDTPGITMAYCCPEGPIRQTLERLGIPYVPLKKFTPVEVRAAIRREKPTLIHTHDMLAAVVTAAVCGRIPMICHIHNNGFDSRKATAKAILFRLAAAKARHIFWVSPSAMESYRFRDAVAGKSSVLRNVLDADALRHRAEEAPLQEQYDIVFLGRMSQPKNPLRLVKVLAAVAAEYPALRAAIIGSGELDEEVASAVAASPAKGNIHMLGFQSNAYGMLKNARMMIMTSLWEGTPMCALEAMALGVPIVSTPVDGLCDLVEPGVTGFLEEKDEDLTERCLEILRDPALRERLSRRTLQKANVLLDTAAYKARLEAVYR